jgi:hypothetical protein
VIVSDSLADSANVSLVKNGHLEGYPDVTVGHLADHFLESPQWSAGEDDNGDRFVNVSGKMTYMDKPVQALIQFTIHEERFDLHAFEMNGIPQNNLWKAEFFAKVYEEHKER